MNFTCTYTQDQKLLQNYYFSVKSQLKKWFILGAILMAGSIALYVWTKEPIDLVFLVLGAGFAVKEILAPYQKAKKAYESLLGKYGLEIPQTTVTVDEQKAVLTFDGQETTISLEDVLGIYVCKDFLVLKGFEEDMILANLPDKDALYNHLKKHCKNAPLYKR